MPHSNEAHEPQLLSQCPRARELRLLKPDALEPVPCNKSSHLSGQPEHHNWRVAPAHHNKALRAMKTQHSQNMHKIAFLSESSLPMNMKHTTTLMGDTRFVSLKQRSPSLRVWCEWKLLPIKCYGLLRAACFTHLLVNAQTMVCKLGLWSPLGPHRGHRPLLGTPNLLCVRSGQE